MKKIFTIILIMGITAGAFAEFKVGWTLDFAPTLFRLTTPTDDLTKATLLYPELDLATGEMKLVEKFNMRYKGSDYELLTGGGQPSTPTRKGTENRIRLWWTDEYYEIYTRLRADSVLASLTRASNPSDVGLFKFLSEGFIDDWYARGKLGMFKAVVGNYNQRGRTPEYEGGFHEFLRNRQDFFGIHLPNIFYNVRDTWWKPDTDTPFESFLGIEDSTESANLRSAYKAGYSDYKKTGSNAFWLFETDFSDLISVPLFLEVFGDMSDFTQYIDGDFDGDGKGWNKLKGGIRISGDKIADTVTFDAMYRIVGFDKHSFNGYTEMDDPDNPGTVINNGMNREPNGEGTILHHFGLYGNVTIGGDLGISLGYTGMLRTYENYLQPAHTGFESGVIIPNRELSFTGPLYSGVDLRLSYTGVDKLGITFNNNVSFATATGTDLNKDSTTNFVIKIWDKDTSMGPEYDPSGRVGGSVLGKDETQIWFSLYNALGVTYKLTDNLTGFINVANRYGMFTWKTKEDDKDPASPTFELKNKAATTIFFQNDLMTLLGVTYTMGNIVTLHGGLSVRYIITAVTYDGAYHSQVQVKSQDRTEGTLTFAIPLWMRIAF